MVSGAALNATIRLSILLRRSQSQKHALTVVEMALGMLLPASRCRCLSIQTVAQHSRLLYHQAVPQGAAVVG
jgi:hypothetical protein